MSAARIVARNGGTKRADRDARDPPMVLVDAQGPQSVHRSRPPEAEAQVRILPGHHRTPAQLASDQRLRGHRSILCSPAASGGHRRLAVVCAPYVPESPPPRPGQGLLTSDHGVFYMISQLHRLTTADSLSFTEFSVEAPQAGVTRCR